MKLTLQIIILTVFFVCVVPCTLTLDWLAKQRRRMTFDLANLDHGVALRAISMLESGDDPKAVGPLGERTAYQFMPDTWATFSKIPFSQAGDYPKEADRVAVLHLRAIVNYLRAGKHTNKVEYVFGAWAYGPRQAVNFYNTDHCRRGANLYYDLLP